MTNALKKLLAKNTPVTLEISTINMAKLDAKAKKKKGVSIDKAKNCVGGVPFSEIVSGVKVVTYDAWLNSQPQKHNLDVKRIKWMNKFDVHHYMADHTVFQVSDGVGQAKLMKKKIVLVERL